MTQNSDEKDRTKGGTVAGWVTFKDGKEADIPVQALREYMLKSARNMLGDSVLEETVIGGGLIRLNVHIEAMEGFSLGLDESTHIPIMYDRIDGLRTDVPYYALLTNGHNEDPSTIELWACDPDALQTDRPDEWSLEKVGLTLEDGTPATADNHELIETLEDGTEVPHTLADLGLDPTRLLSFRNITQGRAVTLFDLLSGIVILRASLNFAMQVQERRNAPMVMRTGKRMTQAMGATNRGGTFDHENGGAFVMAGDLMISADRAEALTLTVGEKKILAYLNHLATVSGYGYEPERSCIVTTTIDEILDKRGLEPTRKNRERARRDVRTLARQAWEFEATNTHEWVRIPLAGGAVKIRRGGIVEFSISSDYMRLVLNPRAGLLPMDPALLRTDDKRNPHAFAIGYKLTTHAYQNYGKANQCTLSVEKLLDYVESIPKPDEVTAQNYTQRIVEPMERDLNALVGCGVLEWWDYSHAKGEPLTDEEQAQRLDVDGNDKALPYDVAVKANIQWQFAHDYKEHMADVVAAREKRSAKALEAREQERARERRRKQRIQNRKERRIADRLADRELAEADKANSGESAPSK